MRYGRLVTLVGILAVGTSVLQAQQKAVTEDGKAVILMPDGTWKYATTPVKTSTPGKTPAVAKAPDSEKKAEREMTPAEKVASWKGEQITLLVDPKVGMVTGSNWGQTYKRGEKGKKLLATNYGGKVGMIVETEMKTESYGPRAHVVVKLDDTGEEIVFELGGFGFIAEMKIAEAIVGKQFWLKGTKLWTNGTYEDRGYLPPLTPVTVTRVSWGKYGIDLDLRTEDTRSWAREFDPEFADCNGSRFHLHSCDPGRKERSGDFFLENPRKLHPTWTATI